MKLLVFSDSHGAIQNMAAVVQKTKGHMDRVIHLGDGHSDIAALSALNPGVSIHSVAGNCDAVDDSPPFRLFTFGGKRVLMTHGHHYRVRSGLLTISRLAEQERADICLFGHTHTPLITSYNSILYFNPGSISYPREAKYPSYGVIEIDGEGTIRPTVVDVMWDRLYPNQHEKEWEYGVSKTAQS